MSSSNSQYNRDLYLSPDQQDLLLAALSSNNAGSNTYPAPAQTKKSPSGRSNTNSLSPQKGYQSNMGNGQFFDSPVQKTPGSGNLSGFPNDESPFLDYEDADGSFDFDFNGAQMIGDLPGDSDELNGTEDGDLHDKRKSIDGNTDDDEGGGKRREGDEKSAKKPGRKPLTSEPTSKRKAQNRAAQRAFRERKEKHLKDLETKVEDLEKASESATHENGLLKAQVERLTIELKEYRKRLSFIGSGNGGVSRSPTAGSSLPSTTARNGPNFHSNDFHFEFPKFGDLPGAHIFNNGSFAKVQDNKKSAKQSAAVPNYSVPGVVSRNSTSSTSPRAPAPSYGSTGASPVTNGKGVKSSSATNYGMGNARQSTGIDGLTDLFSPSILESVSRNSSLDYMSHPGSSSALNQASLAQANRANSSNYHSQTNGSSSVSNTDSPSASSESQHGNVSSIGTSPEPSLNSPSTGKLNDFGLNTISEEHSGLDAFGGETDFCAKLSMACGDSKNPVPRTMSMSNGGDYPLGPAKTPASEINGIDWLAQQNGGQFDPVLFGGYRDSQDGITGQDFGSFFNEAFPLPDLGSPFNNYNPEVATPAPAPKRDLIKEIEEKQNGADEEVVPGEDTSKMLSCNKIWDRLQSIDSFQNGELDIDNLCSELRTKAKCSESGAVVAEKEVDDILKRARAMQKV